MIDFSPVRSKEKTLQDLAEGLTRDDLVRLANEMCDHFQELIATAEDADVPFVPDDPEANDTFAARPEDVGISWTLGHVIVHWTASSEEAAAHALTLARGVEVSGRSRSEVAWEGVTTAAFIRERIEESRRMQLAMLDAWPSQPHLELTYVAREGASPVNAIGRFLGGLSHADAHREQVTNVLAQAQAARSGAATSA
ncbi:MAG TPA: DinB family protein [Candidatus Dormibacteraeota bacterium]|nr:DinB family protein [Candidatus Dormibacteraeota bacterium]